MEKNWYVVHAYSGFEQKVKEKIIEQANLDNLSAMFGKIIIPTEKVVEISQGKKKTNERRIFPGYVLVEMEMNDATWHLICKIPRVLGFVGGTKEKPVPISKNELNQILLRLEASKDKMVPKVEYLPGETVRVNDGPFNDFEAVVESVDYVKNKLDVSIVIFGRTTSVQLDFAQVVKI